MSNRIIRALLLSACLAVTLAYGGVAQAQETDRQLTEIERLATQVETAKTTPERDKLADTLESRLQAYVRATLANFDAAIKQLQATAKSREPNFEALKKLEDGLQNQEKRLNELDKRMQKMKPSSSLQPLEGGKLALGWLLGKIGDAVISPAQAAIALSIYNTCNAKPYNQAACLKAATTGHSQRVAAQSTYNACWSKHANRKPNWVRAALRAGCVAALVARLA